MVYTFFCFFFIGGSESFNDKRDFFYRELVAHHGRKTGEVNLKIDRRNLLESVSEAFYKLVKSDWLSYIKNLFYHKGDFFCADATSYQTELSVLWEFFLESTEVKEV